MIWQRAPRLMPISPRGRATQAHRVSLLLLTAAARCEPRGAEVAPHSPPSCVCVDSTVFVDSLLLLTAAARCEHIRARRRPLRRARGPRGGGAGGDGPTERNPAQQHTRLAEVRVDLVGRQQPQHLERHLLVGQRRQVLRQPEPREECAFESRRTCARRVRTRAGGRTRASCQDPNRRTRARRVRTRTGGRARVVSGSRETRRARVGDSASC